MAIKATAGNFIHKGNTYPIEVSISNDKSTTNVKTSAYGGWLIPVNSASSRGYGAFKFRIDLQRRGTSGTYATIGTKYGYIHEDSPGHRTFTSVTKTGRSIRIKVTLYKFGTRAGGSINWHTNVNYVKYAAIPH